MSSAAPRPDADPVWTLLLVVAVVLIFGWVVWFFFRTPLLEFLRYTRLGEMWVIGLFTNRLDGCAAWLWQAPVGKGVPSAQNAQLAIQCFGASTLATTPSPQVLDYYNLTGPSIAVIGRRTGNYMHVPYALGFVLLILYVVFVSPRNKFKTRHNLETFIKVQAKMWPVISPIVNFKPASLSARVPGSTIPERIPSFAEALSPEEWISWHRVPVTNGIPERESARRAFILQLGPRWQGIEGQPPYMRALFAAFSLKGAQKRDESDELLGRLATCWSLQNGFHMKPEIAAEIEKLIKDPNIGGLGLKAAAQHAYRTTALLAVLKWARSMGGVLASAQFLWLRAVDRGLWYPLNSLGRRSFHAEGSGAMAHFMAEQNAQKPLPIPRVDTAIVAINQFLADPEKHPMPIPPREEPQGKA